MRRRWRAGTLLVRLLPVIPRLRLRSVLLIVLTHYGFLRLITVLLPVQHLLLLHLGISIP